MPSLAFVHCASGSGGAVLPIAGLNGFIHPRPDEARTQGAQIVERELPLGVLEKEPGQVTASQPLPFNIVVVNIPDGELQHILTLRHSRWSLHTI